MKRFASMDAQARKLFKRFRGREASDGSRDIVNVTASGRVTALEIGELVGVIYKKEGVATPFIHRFKISNRPVLYSSFDGSQLYILAGGYELTERGIVG